jgi:hypothetical protein
VTPSQRQSKAKQKAIDIAAYFSAVTLAGCAAWFSIKGMVMLTERLHVKPITPHPERG